MQEERRQQRKKLNQKARESVKGSLHEKVKLIVHQPKVTAEDKIKYHEEASKLMPVIHQLLRKTTPLLTYEESEEALTSKLYGTTFHAENLAKQDFHYFSYSRPPHQKPTLAVALRVDESASMAAFGRLEAAKKAAIAIYEFCKESDIPIIIYGDTANRSKMEEMSLYSYVNFDSDENARYSLMTMKGRSNNRDGMALRIISESLLKVPQETKLLISLSDGQPKALPDYSGKIAMSDMKETLETYRRKGITYLAAAIGQDKEVIGEIYGKENTLDISDLTELPGRLVQIIAKYL